MQMSHCVPVKGLPDPLVAGEFIPAIYGIGHPARQAHYTCPYQIQITPFNRSDPARISPLQTVSNSLEPSGFEPSEIDTSHFNTANGAHKKIQPSNLEG